MFTLHPHSKSWESDPTLTESIQAMSGNDLFTVQYSLRPSLINLSESCDCISSFDDNHLTKSKFRHSIGLSHIHESSDDLKSENYLSRSASSLSSCPECSEITVKSNSNKTKKPIKFSLRRVFSWKKLIKEGSTTEMTLSNVQNIHLSDNLHCKLYHKWNKMWCVVAEGNLYCFKSNKQNEKIQYFVNLADSQINYSSPSLNGHTNNKKTFFIEIRAPDKFILLNAFSASDQVCWINALTKEKVAASTQLRILSSDYNARSEYVNKTLSCPVILTTEIPTTPEKIDYHSISSFIDEKDNGYTTASDDFDNQSSVGSQNGIAESYTPPSLRALAQNVALKLPESDSFSFHDNYTKTISERNNNHWNTKSKMMAHISSTKIAPTHTPARKSLCNVQQPCSPSCDETKSLVHTTTLQTTGRGVQTAKRPVSLPLVENLYTDTTKCNIGKLSSALSMTSLQLQPHTVTSGYLERKAPLEKWSKFWFVLKGNILSCYPKCENPSTLIDYIDLNGCHIVANSEPLPDRQFTFQITTKDGSCSEYCTNNEESQTSWLNHLLTATESCSTSSPSIGSEGFFSSREDLTAYDPSQSCEEFKDKRKCLKQQLLSDMFHQIKDIKQRQELRQNTETENEICDESMCMNRLVQRRMSAQITLQSIQKQMNSRSKKSLFSFGGGSKKKGNSNQKNHLANQVEELNNELEQIDRSLHRHCTDHPEIAKQTSAHLLSADSQTKQSSGLKQMSNITKTLNITSMSRLGLMRPAKLRSNRLTKENRFSTPPVLINSWTAEPSPVNLNENQNLPNSSEDMFLKSLDLADCATKTLSQCSQPDLKQNSHYSYPPDQTQHLTSLQMDPSNKKSNTKISSDALSEIEAFEEFSKKYFNKQMMMSSTSA